MKRTSLLEEQKKWNRLLVVIKFISAALDLRLDSACNAQFFYFMQCDHFTQATIGVYLFNFKCTYISERDIGFMKVIRHFPTAF